MSISDDVRAALILADYANGDSAGKANILGAGWQVTPITQTGTTLPHALVVLIELPPRNIGDDFTVAMTLSDETGHPVQITGPTGESQDMRVTQKAKAERPGVPGAQEAGKLWSRTQIILHFATGLPLTPGRTYTWTLEIDGHHNPQWSVGFYVTNSPAEPVLG